MSIIHWINHLPYWSNAIIMLILIARLVYTERISNNGPSDCVESVTVTTLLGRFYGH